MAARKQFLLRVDPALWAELEKWAADDLRSVNAQVEWLLRDAVRRRRGSSVLPPADGTAGSAPSAGADPAANDTTPD